MFAEMSWLGDEEAFAEAREFLTSVLGISEPPGLIGALHRVVSTKIDIHRPDRPADSLFGRFTIDDNPTFRWLRD